MASFIDFLTGVMTLLIVVDVVICELIFYTLGKNFSKLEGDESTLSRIKSFGLMFLGLSVPLLVFGLVLDAHWPLPSSYNFIFGDMVVYIGTMLLVAGMVMVWKPEDVRLIYPVIAVFSLFVFVYGADILYYSMGQNPLAASGMVVAEGAGGLATAFYLLSSKRFVGYAALAFLAIAIVIIAVTNVESIFAHTVSFKSYFP